MSDSVSALSGEEAGSQIMIRVEKWSAGADRTHHGQRDRRTVLGWDRTTRKRWAARRSQGDRLVGITSTESSAAMSLAQNDWVLPWPGLGLEIQSQEGMKEVVSEKGYEQKAFHGLGVMLENVIGIPWVDQLVKARIFDVPTLVAETDGPLG